MTGKAQDSTQLTNFIIDHFVTSADCATAPASSSLADR
jgi:hypothetical protein